MRKQNLVAAKKHREKLINNINTDELVEHVAKLKNISVNLDTISTVECVKTVNGRNIQEFPFTELKRKNDAIDSIKEGKLTARVFSALLGHSMDYILPIHFEARAQYGENPTLEQFVDVFCRYGFSKSQFEAVLN